MRKNERKYGKRKKVEQMPLTMATMGEVNKIVKVGGNEETRRFLENLGFVAERKSQLYLRSEET